MRCRSCAAALSLAVSLIAGCAQAAGSPTPLERYDNLRPGLTWVTDQSARVASDTRVLSTQVQRGHAATARLDAVRLKRDAQAFAVGSGQYGNQVHSLEPLNGSAPVRRFLAATWRALSADWYEGETLARIADIVWADPLGMVPATAGLLSRLETQAQQFAASAVSNAQAARSTRLRYPHVFRYVPVEKHKAHG